MFYCMINNTTFNDDKININYCLINDPLEIKITKKFNMDIYDNISCIKFSKQQFKDKNVENYVSEILNDFSRSKYIFGKCTFEEYFSQINECNKLKEVNDILKYKYIKVNDILEKLHKINKIKYIL